MKFILTPRLVERIKDNATYRFKNYDYSGYGPELQATVCTILALQDVLARQGIELGLNIESRLPYQSVDED